MTVHKTYFIVLGTVPANQPQALKPKNNTAGVVTGPYTDCPYMCRKHTCLHSSHQRSAGQYSREQHSSTNSSGEGTEAGQVLMSHLSHCRKLNHFQQNFAADTVDLHFIFASPFENRWSVYYWDEWQPPTHTASGKLELLMKGFAGRGQLPTWNQNSLLCPCCISFLFLRFHLSKAETTNQMPRGQAGSPDIDNSRRSGWSGSTTQLQPNAWFQNFYGKPLGGCVFLTIIFIN